MSTVMKEKEKRAVKIGKNFRTALNDSELGEVQALNREKNDGRLSLEAEGD